MQNQEIYLNSTLTYCAACKQVEMARIVARGKSIFLERLCPKEKIKSIKIAADYKWYIERVNEPYNISEQKKSKASVNGCPSDCGLCEWHSGAIHLPIFSITNDCNLDCPKCFTYNRSDKKYYKNIKDTKKIIDKIIEATSNVQLINLTGGEPTLHPMLFDIIEACKHKNINRITMNTNGIKIAEDFKLAERLKESGVQIVLSLDTFNSEKSISIHGKDISQKKKKALQVLESLNIPTTILSVCIKGINETDVVDIANKYIKKDFVRSITIQNMTFTGKNGKKFQPREHITIDEVEKLLATTETFSEDDFFPLASYHPLCYSVAYYIAYKGKILPITKILDKKKLIESSTNSYLLNPDKELWRYFLEGINKLWAESDNENFITELKKQIMILYPSCGDISPQERQEAIEKMVKTIYIHSHMDEDNFDIDRVSRCGDIVPDENGQMIPACSYNLLYREKDPRFWLGK